MLSLASPCLNKWYCRLSRLSHISRRQVCICGNYLYIYRTHLSIQKKSRRSSKSQKECILLRPLLVASDATVSPWIQHVAAEVKVFHHHRWSRLLSMLFINVHDHSRVKECSLQAQNLKVNKRKRTDDIDRMPDWFSHSLCIPLYSLLAPPTSPKTF